MSTQRAKLAADDGDSNDNFGVSVAVSREGTTAIVGALNDEDPNGESAGSAYVFEKVRGSWSQQAKLAADDGKKGDNFGVSVAVSRDGSTALIGAFRDRSSGEIAADARGSTYVFEKAGGSWSQQAKLTADDGDSFGFFGFSVAMFSDGDAALIGAHGEEDPNGKYAGSAYVFENADGSWSQQTKLVADDGMKHDAFGGSVAVTSDGSTAIVGAPADHNHNGENAGSAYVFENAGGSWTQQTKLIADDGDSEDFFGNSVAISSDGSAAFIGAYSDGNSNGKNAGSTYVFETAGGSWSQQTKLVADDGMKHDAFGESVAVSSDGDTAIIGANKDEDPNGDQVGSAYVFEKEGGSWSQQTKLVADDGDSADYFGESVAVSSDGDTAIIGAYKDEDPNGDQSGSAYVFML